MRKDLKAIRVDSSCRIPLIVLSARLWLTSRLRSQQFTLRHRRSMRKARARGAPSEAVRRSPTETCRSGLKVMMLVCRTLDEHFPVSWRSRVIVLEGDVSLTRK